MPGTALKLVAARGTCLDVSAAATVDNARLIAVTVVVGIIIIITHVIVVVVVFVVHVHVLQQQHQTDDSYIAIQSKADHPRMRVFPVT